MSVDSFIYGVAVDIGIKNMGICALKLPCTTDFKQRSLVVAKDRLQKAELISWESVPLLVSSESTKFVAETFAVAEFVRSREHIFDQASYVVVEHQMAPKMRCIAAAFMACIAYYRPTLPVHFQLSKTKLSWQDLNIVLPERSLCTYGSRKRTAIEAVTWLLDLPLKRKRGRSCTTPIAGDINGIFDTHAKQDDLADSLLHLLVFDTTALKRKRKVGTASGEAMEENALTE